MELTKGIFERRSIRKYEDKAVSEEQIKEILWAASNAPSWKNLQPSRYFVAMGEAAALPALMAEMERQNMTLITIHDRPLKTELGQYYYLIECADSSYASYLKLTQKSEFTFRYLGSFDAL